MNNSFKSWLTEEDEALDGIEKIGRDIIDAGKKAHDKTIDTLKTGVDKHNKQDAGNKAAQRSANADAVINYINKYISNLFSQFPYVGGAGGPEDFLQEFETREDALQAFDIYKNMAKTLEGIQKSFNARLIQTKKIDKARLQSIMQSAKADADSGSLDSKVEAFAKSESQFFTELLTVQKQGQTQDAFDKDKFINRLSKRFANTDAAKIPLAIESLNTLFIYLIADFTEYAKTIAEAGTQRPKNESVVHNYFLKRLL